VKGERKRGNLDWWRETVEEAGERFIWGGLRGVGGWVIGLGG